MRLIRERDVMRMTGASRSTVNRWRREKNFPSPGKLAGGHGNFWREEDVERWIEENFKQA